MDLVSIDKQGFLLTGVQEINFEYSKIAPQNIMYDRRVVRGNTFAALVIPVSKAISFKHVKDMQPDPVMLERQKQE